MCYFIGIQAAISFNVSAGISYTVDSCSDHILRQMRQKFFDIAKVIIACKFKNYLTDKIYNFYYSMFETLKSGSQLVSIKINWFCCKVIDKMHRMLQILSHNHEVTYLKEHFCTRKNSIDSCIMRNVFQNIWLKSGLRSIPPQYFRQLYKTITCFHKSH